MSGPDEPSEAQVLQAAELTTALRGWLQARRAHPDMVLATALAYELCALIARNASTEADALALMRGAVVGGRKEVIARAEWCDQWIEDQTVPIAIPMHRRRNATP